MFNRWMLSIISISLLCCFSGCRKSEPIAKKESTLRISTESDPHTLDPRRVRDLNTTTAIHMLYEGLTRNNANGEPEAALAESITISPDQKQYTFKLKKSAWSDGQPVTAYDFERTWKSTLDPQFACPNAYQFYSIKEAKNAKEGKCPIEHVGVQALDSSTLLVELEQPTPYFLHLTATHFFYPVHPSLHHDPLNTHEVDETQILTNGPFKLEKWSRQNELVAVPNPYYWDNESIRLDRIALVVLDNPTALQLFQSGELDWTGSPLSSLSSDALASLRLDNKLEVKPAAGVYLFRINTDKAPFNNPKMRQAFALAINRSALIEHVLQGNQSPAMGIIPPSFIQKEDLFQDHDVELAKELYEQALNEQEIAMNDFPETTLCYAAGERAHKIAQVVQQQWKDTFGVMINLQSCEGKSYFSRLSSQDYQMGIGSWFADIRDPISFLEVFKLKHNGTNNTQWENSHYVELLDHSSTLHDPQEREHVLNKAESVLIKDMPIIPLFYSSYNYVKNPSVKNVYFSELGYLDFKHAYVDPNE